MMQHHAAPSPLEFEGDTEVLAAIVRNDPGVHYIHVGNGMGAVSSTGFASALRVRQSTPTPFVGTSFSSGVVNQILAAYDRTKGDTGCYCSHFCTERFVTRGLWPWLQRRKVNINHYGAVLRTRLRNARPAHPESRLNIVVTNYETGKAEVLTPDLANVRAVVQAAKASAYLPCTGKGYVLIDGVPYTDGGIAAPIPLQAALQQQPKFLLLLMASAEHSSWRYRAAEWLIVRRTLRGKYAERALRAAAHGRHQAFAAALAYIRSQLKLPQGSPERVLPPIMIVWPKEPVGIVEQDVHIVGSAMQTTFHAWLRKLQQVQDTMDGVV